MQSTKRIALILILLNFTSSIQTIDAQRRKTSLFIFTPHWYLGANAGMNSYWAEGWDKYSPSQSVGYLSRISAGYNFNEVLGARGMIGYSAHNWPEIRMSDFNYSFSAANIIIDNTINMSNLIDVYYLNRPIDILLFGGLEFSYRERAKFRTDLYTCLLRGGLQIDYRLTSFWDLNLSTELNIAPDNYNDYAVGRPVDIYWGLTLGITYNFRNSCNICRQNY